MGSLGEAIQEAHRGIRPAVPVAALERSTALSARLGVEVWLKCEHLQPTGSFKIRGATNKIRLLGAEGRRKGVVTASTGNHGRAVAHAGRAANVPVTAFAASSAPHHKLEAIRSLGAKLVTVAGIPLEVEQRARAHAESVGLPYISPYNDVEVVAGQGTIGMELLEQLPELDAVFVSVGGGGLIGGIGTALRHQRPRTRVVGVWPENSVDLLKRLRPDQVADATERPTLSDSTAGAIEPDSVTIDICKGSSTRRSRSPKRRSRRRCGRSRKVSTGSPKARPVSRSQVSSSEPRPTVAATLQWSCVDGTSHSTHSLRQSAAPGRGARVSRARRRTSRGSGAGRLRS